jgi:two-component system chemotaxis response regulator CheB
MAIRVLTVDDSPFFLEVLAGIIASVPGLTLIGSARDGREAVQKVVELSPDAVTLDVEMPLMDGLEALARIMAVRPVPVVMVSAHTRRASSATIRALMLGACDFVAKPARSLREGLDAFGQELAEKLTAVGARRAAQLARPAGLFARPAELSARPAGPFARLSKARVVVIGASTGGTSVITRLLDSLPGRMEATVIVVQHMPALWTSEFADRLRQTVRCPVAEAASGAVLEPGAVFVAPGGLHCTVYGTTFKMTREDPVQGHRPSIDVTMHSVARRFGPAACGILLTGIGSDGARGIEEIKDAGGMTAAQDEASCVVFGMPKAAIATGKVDRVLSDEELCRFLQRIVA